MEISEYVAGPEDDESGFTLAGRLDLKEVKLEDEAEEEKKQKSKSKKTLKDLAELRWEFDE